MFAEAIADLGGMNPSKNSSMYWPPVGEKMPNKGKNYLSYSGRFGGTSAACPLVAGVAALILSQNSQLTQEEVFNVLTTQVDKIGGYSYLNGLSNETVSGRLNAGKCLRSVAKNNS